MTMAQTSSAQREPSMEEILASIRRIIEDSDTVRKPERRNRPPLMAQAEPDETQAGTSHGDPFRTSFEPANSDRADLRAPSIPQPEEDEVDAGVAKSFAAPDAAETAPDGLPADESDTFDLPENFADDVFDLDPAVIGSPIGEDQTPAMDAGPVDEMEPEPEDEPRRSPILSEATGRQVAAAFGELTDAFAATRRKSFDEMAAEMLRPMLQDWLDNNLPTLVEKLVREEIERVARGSAG